MNKNKALWQRAFTTDPRAVKEITGKQYRGNSPKPYWIVERLTDEFGPCGIGWGFQIINERFERFSETDSLHVASVRFWYVLDGVRGELEQIGQTKSSYTTGAGKFMLDEDAPKKSVTDALVKCASYLGFAGDIFSGRWDDSKYVAAAGKEWKEREQEEKSEKLVEKPAAPTAEKPPEVKVPAEIEGDSGRFSIKITAKPNATAEEWVSLVSEAIETCMEMATSIDQLNNIWHLNPSLWDKLQKLNKVQYTTLIAKLKGKKESLK